MRYQVVHATNYWYSEAVPLCPNDVHLKPRDTARQTCRAHRLAISPRPQKLEECQDYFGNPIHFFTIGEGHQELSVSAHSEVELRFDDSVTRERSAPWEQVRAASERVPPGERVDVRQFAFDSPHVTCDAALAEFAGESFAAGREWLEAALDLMGRIHRDFAYDPTATNVSTPLATVLAMRRGVCQDFAHLQIGCLRSLGLPARYVSGYLLTTPPPGQPRLVGADASHAWASAWCEEFGWVDFDPTNNGLPTLGHVTVAWGRDYSDVCPIKGIFVGGGQHRMNVSVDVTPVGE
jgi:transglutaminase-like putative cysteine protease